MSESLTPEQVEIEQMVLGCILGAPQAMAQAVSDVTDADFVLPLHRAIWSVMVDLYRAGTPPASDAVFIEMMQRKVDGANLGYLLGIQDPVAVTSLGYHVNRLRDLSIQRMNGELGQWMVDAGGTIPPEEYRAERDRRMAEIEARRQTVVWDTRPELWERVHNHIFGDDLVVGEGVPYGLSTLHQYLGNVRPGRLYTVAADTGHGKTSLSTTMARYIASELKEVVAFFSLEMDPVEMALKFVSIEARVPVTSMESVDTVDALERQRISNAVKRLSQCPLFIYEAAGWTVTMVQDHIQALGLYGAPPALAVVDYLQIIEPTVKGRGTNRTTEVSGMSRDLRFMAQGKRGGYEQRLHDPVAVLSPVQVNRESSYRKGNELHLSDIRESASIAQDSWAVMLMWPDEEAREDVAVTPVFVKVGKNRMAPKGRVTLGFRGDRSEFVDYTEMYDSDKPF